MKEDIEPNEIKKIILPLYGISEIEENPNHGEMVHCGQFTDPPSYLMKILITLLFKSNPTEGGEKSEWQCAFTYDGLVWVLRDWKRCAMDLYCTEDRKISAERLKKRLLKASRNLNIHINKLAKSRFDRDEFSLQNMSHKYLRLYRRFRQLAENQIILIDSFKTSKKIEVVRDFPLIASSFNKMSELRHDLEAYSGTAIIYYFSYTESLFDCCFSLLCKNSMNYAKFSNLSWPDKFKLFLRPWNKEIDGIYNCLVRIRRENRSSMAHSSAIRYINYQDFGWIPSDQNDLMRPISKVTFSIDEIEMKSIFNTFDDFLNFVESHEKCKFPMAYLNSSLPIVMDERLIAQLQKHMVNLDTFTEEIAAICQISDAFENMELIW